MKKFLCTVVSVALLLSLCGCKKEIEENSSSDLVEVIEQVVIEDEQGNKIDGDNEVSVNNSDPGGNDKIDISDNEVTDNSSGNTKPDDTLSQESQDNIYSLSDAEVLKSIKLNGRCQTEADGVGLNFVASAIEFNIDGGGAVLDVYADSAVWFSVFIDGKLKDERYELQAGSNYVIAARALSNGNHNIKFVREGESKPNACVTVKSIQLDDGKTLLSKSSDNTLIEFLGDSMTSGYGNLVANGASNSAELKSQNSLKAYPYLIASNFGLDYRIVSMSGIALKLRSGYPTFYDFYNAENYHKDKSKKYTSSNPKDVDIVVVNLGTNDVSQELLKYDDAQSVAEYAKLYTELITNIGYDTDTKIVFISGIMWCHHQKSAYEGAKSALNALGYNNVYVYDVANTYNSGGGGHPSVDEHRLVADELIKFFKDNGIA